MFPNITLGTFFKATGKAIIGFLTSPQVQLALMAAQGIQAHRTNKKLKKGQEILLTKYGTGDGIPVIYGTRRAAGTVVFMETVNQKELFVVYAIAVGEVDDIDDLRIDGRSINDNSVYRQGYTLRKEGNYFGGTVASENTADIGNVLGGAGGDNPRMVFNIHHGSSSQEADPMLFHVFDGSATSRPNSWTADHKLSGIAYIAANFEYDTQGMFTGIPNLTARVKGKKVLDTRTSATGYSSNPAMCLRDYLTNDEYGKGIAAGDLDATSFNTAANDCDSGVQTISHTSVPVLSASTVTDRVKLQNESDFHKIKTGTTIAFVSGGTTYFSGRVLDKDSTIFREDGDTATSYAQHYYLLMDEGAVTTAITSTTSGTITETQPRFECHAVIDTDETVLENTKDLIANMRGIFTYTNGTYSLDVEGTESSVVSLDEDDILESGLELALENKEQKYNKVEVEFYNSSKKYEADTVVVTDGLSDDGNEVLEHRAQFPFVTNQRVAYNHAEAILNRSRNNRSVSFVATPKVLKARVGEVITITSSDLNLSAEPYRITQMNIMPDLNIQVNAVEYQASVYGWQDPPAEDIGSNPTPPDPFRVVKPTSLAYVAKNTTTGEPAKLTWSDSTEYPSFEFRVQILSDSNSKTRFDKRVKATEIYLDGINIDTGFFAKVSAINSLGTESDPVELTFAVTTAPITTVDIGQGSIGGFSFDATKMYHGTGTFNNTNTAVYFDNAGQFSLKDKLSWNGTTLNISGNLTVENTINANKIVLDGINLDSLITATTQSGSIYLTEFTGIKIATAGGTSGYPPLLKLQDDQGTNTFTDITQTTQLNIRARNNTAKGAIVFQGVDSGGTPVNYGGFDASGNFEIGSTDVIDASRNVNNLESINMPDSKKIKLGTGSDLQIYHDSNNSYIDNSTADLRIRGAYVKLQGLNGENMLVGNQNGAVELYHDNSKKFETTSTGVAITGNATISGDLTVSGTTTTIDTTNLDVKDKNITLNYGSGDTSSNANGAGITIQDAVSASTDATILWDATNDKFNFSHGITTASIGTVTIDELTVSNDTTLSGGASFSGDATFGDNNKAKFGAGSDLEIFHQSSNNNSIIKESGSGILSLQTNGSEISFYDTANSQFLAKFQTGSQVILYNNGVQRFNTSGSGIDVTGSITADDYRTDGSNVFYLTSASDWRFRKTSGTEHARLTAAGQFLINQTSSNGDILEVTGDANVFAARLNGSTTGGQSYGLRIRAGTNSTDKGLLIENTGGTDLFAVCGDGTIDIAGTQILDSSRNLTNIGTISSGAITVSGTYPKITLTDTDNNPDFTIIGGSGQFGIYDETNSAYRLQINSSGNATFAGDIDLSDNKRLKIGNASNGDLSFIHDGTNTYIQNITGDLDISNTQDDGDIFLKTDNGSGGITTYLKADGGNGTLQLMHYGSLKLSTTSSGISVTGEVNLTGELEINGVDVIDSSRNLTNINEISLASELNFTGNGNKIIDVSTKANSNNFKIRHHDPSDNSFETAIQFTAGGGAAINHAGSTKLATTSSGVQVTGTLDVDVISNASGAVHLNDTLYFQDNSKAVFGDSSDLQIYHDGSNSRIHDNGTGGLILSASQFIVKNSAQNENMMVGTEDGAVQLYYNNAAKLATTSTGIDVTGTVVSDGLDLGDNEKIRLGASQDLEIYHDGSQSLISETGTGNLSINGTSINFNNNDLGGRYAEFVSNGAVNLFHAGSKKFETTSTGIDVTGSTVTDGITSSGTITSSSASGFVASSTTGTGLTTNNSVYLRVIAPAVESGHTTKHELSMGWSGAYDRTYQAPKIDGTFDFADEFGYNFAQGNWYFESRLKVGALNIGANEVIDSSRNLTNISTISIGTTSPKAKLHVANSATPTFNTDTHAGESIFVRAGGGTSSGDAQGVIGFGKADGTSDRTGAAIASVQTDTDVDKVGLGFYTSGSSASTQTMTQKVLINHLGNVGIGTTSPSAKLDIVGSKDSTNLIVSAALNTVGGGSLADYNEILFDNTQVSGASGQAYIRHLANSHNDSESAIAIGTTTTGGTTAEALRIRGSGNLGIGTSSPSKKLHVNSGTSDIVALFESSDTTATIELKDPTASSQILNSVGMLILKADPSNASGSTRIGFETDGSERMRIDSSGRLGVGTTSPSGTLHISGGSSTFRLTDTGITDANHNTLVAYAAAQNKFALGVSSTTGTSADITIDGGNDRVGIGTTSPAHALHVVGNILSTGSVFVGDSSSDVLQALGSIVVGSGSGTTVIDNALNHRGNSYVVGTTTVIDSSRNLTNIAQLSSTGSHLVAITSGVGVGGTPADANSAELGAGFLNLARDDTADAKQILFGKNGAVHSYIETTSSGLNIGGANVGIGISSGMTYPLTIQDNNSSNSYVHFVNSTTGTAYNDGSQIGVPSGGTDLLILNRESANIKMYTGGSERARIDSSGNVGIGTTSPGTKLVVSGADDTASTGVLELKTSGGTNLKFGGDTSYSWIQSHASKPLYINQLGNNVIFNSGGGNVGIGTTSPSQKLHVAGNIYAASGFVNSSGYQLNGTYIVDSSRNLVNINSLSVADYIYHTGDTNTNILFATDTIQLNTGGSLRLQANNSAVTALGVPLLVSAPNSAKLQLKQTTASTTARKGGLEWYSATGGYAAGSISIKGNGASDNSGIMEFYVTSEDDEITDPYDLSKILTLTDTSATIAGSLSKQSGSFKIDHPLKPDTHHLVHSFVESPQADNTYTGQVQLKDGYAVINLDEWFGLTEGTFVALNRDFRVFTTNETDWDAVRGRLVDNKLTIECQNGKSNATVSWLVVGERQDDAIYESSLTDDFGKIVVEPEKVG